ncbi:MAG: class I SAM-dependent RNA methyltransferase [Candidatus Magnetominusculus sp. LBB02]|nr:class I SAM-dependent RNA methyltransferase [Candidatus Magnetominusculus sp. LBB02]
MKTLELDCLAPIYGGMCLSRLDGVIFIKGAVPGEKVLAELKETRRDYSIAEAVEILSASADRVNPRCRFYGICGGCHYQHISYDRQLSIKEEILTDCLRRIAKIDVPLDATVFGAQFNYRRKVQFKLTSLAAVSEIGFYKENTRDVVAVDECALLHGTLNRFLAKLSGARFLSGVREVHMLTGTNGIAGTNTVALLKGPEVDEAKLDFMLDIGFDGAVGSVAQDICTVGQPYCLLSLGDNADDTIEYAVSPQGFFQSNWELNQVLVDKVKELLGDVSGKRVIDVYGGAGNFSLGLAKTAKEITIVEDNPFSAADGVRNIEHNGLTNVSYITKPFEKIKENKTYDIVIVDPPRIGLTKAAAEKLLTLKAETIAYISCNPSTFARDAAKLQGKYKLSSVRLIDMFPNTYHCEVLGIFHST